MDRHTPAITRLLILLLAALAAPAGGCLSFSLHGDPDRGGRLVGVYGVDGVLSAELPMDYTAPTVIAAAEATLIHRGYVITEKRANKGSAKIEGREHRQGLSRIVARRIIIEAREGGGRTSVTVCVRPIGERAESRAVLDGVLNTLGR
ncbi:MAG: hypothetical protein EA376_11430 [Phycisphaeraceae bacterium]|nr:MAG: hypothetical protein EA376_11430 [Phycisphaeraceae bacterium]